jgi:putative SOS response-associated peptidase YedK
MCGRFVYQVEGKLIESRYEIEGMEEFLVDWSRPRYNCAPMSQQLVVIGTPEGRKARAMQWWFVPPRTGDTTEFMRKYTTFNARDDKIAKSPFYKDALKTHRCVVPVSGFYEWKWLQPGNPKSSKTPHYIFPAEGQPKLWSLAGLWARWERAGQAPIESFTIITVRANALMTEIHNKDPESPRMPAILSDDAVRAWLDPAEQDVEGLLALLQPYPDELMQAHAVRPFKSADDSPLLIQPADVKKKLTGTGDLF